MRPAPGQQILLNDKPALVLAVAAGEACWAVSIFWPGVPAPPVVHGIARPGAFARKTHVLMYLPIADFWGWEISDPVNVRPNRDETTHITWREWDRAYAHSFARRELARAHG